MKKQYEAPEFEVILLNLSDVITQSVEKPDWGGDEDDPFGNSVGNSVW